MLSWASPLLPPVRRLNLCVTFQDFSILCDECACVVTAGMLRRAAAVCVCLCPCFCLQLLPQDAHSKLSGVRYLSSSLQRDASELEEPHNLLSKIPSPHPSGDPACFPMSAESVLSTSSVHEAVQISPSLHRVMTREGKAIVVKTLQTHALNAQELQELLDEVKALWMPNRHNNIVSPPAPCNIARVTP